MKNGEIGKVHVIKTCSRDSGLQSVEYLRHSGGYFSDSGIHDIDVVCWLTGEGPSSVFAQAHAFHLDVRAVGDVDTVVIVMKFPSGTIATIDLSRHGSYGYDQRLEVYGDGGLLSADNVMPTTVRHAMAKGQCTDPILSSFTQRYKEAYERELDHFVDVLLKEDELKLTKRDAVRAIKIAEVCQESYTTGRAVPFNDEEA
eukprot:m.55615 g.55615  ORF g.55615 m.55615 type:complete len:200 (+) comp34493_c0_seq1:421-1020(+)